MLSHQDPTMLLGIWADEGPLRLPSVIRSNMPNSIKRQPQRKIPPRHACVNDRKTQVIVHQLHPSVNETQVPPPNTASPCPAHTISSPRRWYAANQETCSHVYSCLKAPQQSAGNIIRYMPPTKASGRDHLRRPAICIGQL